MSISCLLCLLQHCKVVPRYLFHIWIIHWASVRIYNTSFSYLTLFLRLLLFLFLDPRKVNLYIMIQKMAWIAVLDVETGPFRKHGTRPFPTRSSHILFSRKVDRPLIFCVNIWSHHRWILLSLAISEKTLYCHWSQIIACINMRTYFVIACFLIPKLYSRTVLPFTHILEKMFDSANSRNTQLHIKVISKFSWKSGMGQPVRYSPLCWF